MSDKVPTEPTPAYPFLVLYTDSGKRYLPLVGVNCWTVGRSEDNNFVITDRWISRNHAMLQVTETGEFYLIDLGSRNGSFVNGRRVSIPVTLRNADRLTFGQTEMEFHNPISKTPDNSIGTDDGDTSTLHVRQLASVMVVDIRNFTGLTQQLEESTLSSLIGTWFAEVGKIIKAHGSWVDKYIGDAVMAVWFHRQQGVSSEEMLHILRAVSDLYHMTNTLNDRYELPFKLRIGTGINTGYAMVGNTGSGDRPDYTAIGDTVNAAFRLESSTKELGLDIALGENTYKYLTNLGMPDQGFIQHTVALKGYEKPTITYASTYAELDLFIEKFVK